MGRGVLGEMYQSWCRRAGEALVRVLAGRVGCEKTSLEELEEKVVRRDTCGVLLASLLAAHPVLLSCSPGVDARIVAGYNALWLLLRTSSGLSGIARRVAGGLMARLRSYAYERSVDYYSAGLPLAVVEERRGYPLYFSFQCSRGAGGECGLSVEEGEGYRVYRTWMGGVVLEQVVPARLSPEFFRAVGVFSL